MTGVQTCALPILFRRVRDGCDIRELDTSKFARGNDLCNNLLDNRDEEIKNLKKSGEENTCKILMSTLQPVRPVGFLVAR